MEDPSAKTRETGYILEADLNDELDTYVVAAEPPTDHEPGQSDLVTTVDWSQQRVILPQGITRSEAVQLLTRGQPQNPLGLPMGYIRSDLLPYDLELLSQGDIDAAVVKLDYSEGYPVTPKGGLFWSRLDHEPYEAYVLFTRWLDQAETVGIRQLELLAKQENIELLDIQALYREYLWQVRTKACDLFQVAADRKRREHRIRSSENKHFGLAGGLIEQLMPAFDDPEWINNISPVEAIEILEKLVKIQRLSLGLTGQNSSSFQAPGGGETVEVIMRNLAAQGGGTGQVGEQSADLQQLMADPNFAMKAQELIIRATRGGAPQVTNQEASFG